MCSAGVASRPRRRRAARALLTEAREKPLPHLSSAELDKLLETSRHFTSHKTDNHDEFDGLWESLVFEEEVHFP